MANIKKNTQGYGYKYTDLAAINDYIESIGETYTQEVTTLDGIDYIQTNRINKDGAVNSLRGCRVIQASLSGKVNPAQEQGSGLTYARRYSLLMAYGLATEDDDAESMTSKAKVTPYWKKAKESEENLIDMANIDDGTPDPATAEQINEFKALATMKGYGPGKISATIQIMKTKELADKYIAQVRG